MESEERWIFTSERGWLLKVGEMDSKRSIWANGEAEPRLVSWDPTEPTSTMAAYPCTHASLDKLATRSSYLYLPSPEFQEWIKQKTGCIPEDYLEALLLKYCRDKQEVSNQLKDAAATLRDNKLAWATDVDVQNLILPKLKMLRLWRGDLEASLHAFFELKIDFFEFHLESLAESIQDEKKSIRQCSYARELMEDSSFKLGVQD